MCGTVSHIFASQTVYATIWPLYVLACNEAELSLPSKRPDTPLQHSPGALLALVLRPTATGRTRTTAR